MYKEKMMVRSILASGVAIALVACGSPSDNDQAAPEVSGSSSAATAPAAASGDPCTLLTDPAATIGQPVTAESLTQGNGTRICNWKNAEGRLCATVNVLGAGWNYVPDVPRNYEAMAVSMGAFGTTQEVSGIGEEARAVVTDSFLGTQLAFRTKNAAVLVAAACAKGAENLAVAENVSRAIAARL